MFHFNPKIILVRKFKQIHFNVSSKFPNRFYKVYPTKDRMIRILSSALYIKLTQQNQKGRKFTQEIW
jgi:hypothetical protein